MHTVFALLCFVVVIHWLIYPYPSGLLHWHCGNLTIASVPAKQPWWIWINTSCEFIMNDCITTTKQSTTKPCAYFLGYTVNGHTDLPSKKAIYDSSIIFHFDYYLFMLFITSRVSIIGIQEVWRNYVDLSQNSDQIQFTSLKKVRDDICLVTHLFSCEHIRSHILQ